MSRMVSAPEFSFRLLFVAMIMSFAGQSDGSDKLPNLKALTPAVRERVDRRAAEHPLDTLQQEKRNVAGNISLWALSHLALAPEDEREHADSAHKLIVQNERKIDTPPAAQRVLSKLLDNLPPHLKPDAFDYSLTVLDQKDANVFTLGGGYIYISRPLLEALLADKERGEAALAFILAHQIGHIGLDHTRRGWQSYELHRELQRGIDMHIARDDLRDALHTHVENAGARMRFLYSYRQVYEADLFAWQLCRNAGLPVEKALDALRLLVLVEHPRLRTEEAYRPDADDSGRAGPSALLRLRRLFMERDGLVDDVDDKYGLFLWNERDDTLHRCPNQLIKADDQPIIFVHGFRGSTRTFRDYLKAFAADEELSKRKLLVFRYPNNTSLSRCGHFLHNEMRRVVASPEKAFFVCHSAGGLVFRWYSEVRKQSFDRAILLSTPNEGTSVTTLKYLADLGALVNELRMNGPGALERMIPEGEGQIVYDVHADSLFLRHLGHNAELARRYHVFSGECLRRGQVLALGVGLTAAKRVMMNRLLPRIESPVLQRQALRRIERLHLPQEISRGDLVVSVPSALLKDAGHSTRTALNHEQFTHDENVIADVVASIKGK